MLFLNEDHIRKAVSMKDVIDAVDRAYEIYESNEFHMPTRIQSTKDGNTLLAMPCLTDESIGTKIVTVFPENKTKPTIHGLVVLHDSDTGEIVALLDGAFLTAIRTGAVGGSAIRHLAPENARRLAVIGAGTQGLHQAIAACSERNITDIYVYNRTFDKIPNYIDKLYQWIDRNINIHPVETSTEAIKPADIVITATSSVDPVIPDSQSLLKGKLFVGIGSFQPHMREFSDSLYLCSNTIFVDSQDAIKESGDLLVPLKNNWIQKGNIQLMSTFLSRNKDIDPSNKSSIIFKSTGMALFDIVVSHLIYKKAMEKGIGQKLG